MCIFWTVKYLCNCIYDELYHPCEQKKQKTQCYQRNVQETTDALTLCERCFAGLDSRIRKDGVKKVLQSAEAFPLAEQLGVLMVLENDDREQSKIFGKGEQVLFYQDEWVIPGI